MYVCMYELYFFFLHRSLSLCFLRAGISHLWCALYVRRKIQVMARMSAHGRTAAPRNYYEISSGSCVDPGANTVYMYK